MLWMIIFFFLLTIYYWGYKLWSVLCNTTFLLSQSLMLYLLCNLSPWQDMKTNCEKRCASILVVSTWNLALMNRSTSDMVLNFLDLHLAQTSYHQKICSTNFALVPRLRLNASDLENYWHWNVSTRICFSQTLHFHISRLLIFHSRFFIFVLQAFWIVAFLKNFLMTSWLRQFDVCLIQSYWKSKFFNIGLKFRNISPDSSPISSWK